MIKEKVSANSFFLLLYLSCLSTVFMYLSSPQIKISQTDTLLRPLMLILVSFIVAIPAFYALKCHKRLKSRGLFVRKTLLLKIVAGVYATVYFISILRTVARFDLFVSSELFPNSDMFLFLLSIIVVCTVLSVLGTGSLSRAAVVFCFLVGISTFIVMFSLLDEISIFNFTSLFSNGVGSFIEESLIFTFQITELGTLIIFLPFVEGNVKKSFVTWSVVSSLSFSVIFLFVVGSLGGFADTQLFPTYTSVTLASFGLLERIDALETSIWILCVVLKLSLYFLVVIKSIKYSVNKVSDKTIGFFVATGVSVVISVVSRNIERFSFLSSDILTMILFIICTVVLPVAVCLYLKEAPCEKIPEDI